MMAKLFLHLIGKVLPGGNTKLWKIGMNDAMPQALPMPRAFRGSYSPDGKSFAYELNIRWDGRMEKLSWRSK